MQDRMTRIFFWLLHSPLVIKHSELNAFFLPAGQYVSLQDSPPEEVLSWLDREGFRGVFAVYGYRVQYGRDENDRDGVWFIRVIDVPFASAPRLRLEGMDECPF